MKKQELSKLLTKKMKERFVAFQIANNKKYIVTNEFFIELKDNSLDKILTRIFKELPTENMMATTLKNKKQITKHTITMFESLLPEENNKQKVNNTEEITEDKITFTLFQSNELKSPVNNEYLTFLAKEKFNNVYLSKFNEKQITKDITIVNYMVTIQTNEINFSVMPTLLKDFQKFNTISLRGM